jgi:hypothetical protein
MYNSAIFKGAVMKKSLVLLIAFLTISFISAAEESVFLTATLIPKPSPAALSRAQASAKDRFGIPEDIYGINAALKAYKDKIENEEVSSAFVFWSGVGLIPLGYILAQTMPQLVWAPYGVATGIPYGYFAMGAGGAFIIWDLALIGPGIDKMKAAMTKFYNDSYRP